MRLLSPSTHFFSKFLQKQTAGKQIILDFVNTCHRNLIFTLEGPCLEELPFLNLSMQKTNSEIVST